MRDVHEGMRDLHEGVRDVHEGQQILLNHFGKPKPKNGSQLSGNEFRAFSASQYKAHNYASHPVSEEVANLIEAYVDESTRLSAAGNLDEVKYVQPRSLTLCQALFRVLLPDIFDELSFCRKGSGSEYTSYSTVLMTAEGEACLVKGETDISIVYMGKCIMVWEDKKLTLELFEGFKPRSQVLAEVKAMNQLIHESLQGYPPRFCGVLTNGIDWSIAQAIFREGKQLFFISEPCKGSLAHKIIAFCINQAGVVARFVADRTSSLVQVSLTIGEFDDPDADDGARDDDTDDIAPTRKALSTLSMATLPTRSSAGAGAGVSSSSKGKTVAGSKKKSSGEQNNYLTITSENLLNHEMSGGVLNPFVYSFTSLQHCY